MATCRGLHVICLFLASLHTFMQPEYRADRISERGWIRKLAGSPTVLTVAKDGKGQGVFTSVQEAINAVPVNNKSPVVINVKPGTYSEKVTIPDDKAFITLSGSDAKNTIITWNDSSRAKGGTFLSATVSVFASYFTARQITFQNSYGPGKMVEGDQAVALRISGDRSAFYDCRFLGYQDTLLDESGRHYFRNCYIEGAIDVIFGNGKSVYQNCELHAIPINNGAFTAHKRSSPSEDTGFIFLQCKLTGKGLMYLGRAWGTHSLVLFANSYMDGIIFPEGWADWEDPSRQRTVYYGQYQCDGPGAIEDKRVPWSHKFTDRTEIQQYLSISYIEGDNWITQK